MSRTIGRGRDTGSWLSTRASSVNGTHLGNQEFKDALRMRFAKDPKGLQDKCDGCGAKFDLEHSLHCKTGGLIHGRHDDLSRELMSLAAYAVGECNVRAEPLINPGSSAALKSNGNDSTIDQPNE